MNLKIELTEAEAARLLYLVRIGLAREHGVRMFDKELPSADMNILTTVGHIYTEAYINERYPIKTEENIIEAVKSLNDKLSG
jgi:hypothetical protein